MFDQLDFSSIEPSDQQRLLLLGAFVAIGLLFSVQLSQTAAPAPLRWTQLTPETKYVSLFSHLSIGQSKSKLNSTNLYRPYWYTLYVLEAFLAVQNTYPNLLRSMESLLATGYEDKILNAVWVGLLGLEVLMVLGVAVRGVVKRVSPAAKAKTS
jgi:hypothetical protein